MNYDCARQIKDSGLWHFTSMNDGHVHPIGYCSIFRDCQSCGGKFTFGDNQCKDCHGNGVVKAENPCPGHSTAEEAEEHYYEYQLDHLMEIEFTKDVNVVDGRQKCAFPMCELPTLKGLRVRGGDASLGSDRPLCDEHRNRDGFSATFPLIHGLMNIHS